MKRILNLLLAVTLMLMVMAGCDAIFGPDEEYNAGEIIKDSLKSPSSFKKLDGKVLWRGKNDFGDSFVVRITYEAKNSFGASIKNCQVVAYSFNGKQLHWNPGSSIWPCKTVRDNPSIIEGFAEGNGLGKGSLVGMKSTKPKTVTAPSESDFVKNWRSSFVSSCSGENAAQARIDMCKCVAEKTIQSLNEQQMQDQEFAMNHIKQKILPQCQ